MAEPSSGLHSKGCIGPNDGPLSAEVRYRWADGACWYEMDVQDVVADAISHYVRRCIFLGKAGGPATDHDGKFDLPVGEPLGMTTTSSGPTMQDIDFREDRLRGMTDEIHRSAIGFSKPEGEDIRASHGGVADVTDL